MKAKKGVSPVIAEVLLMGIAITAAISGGVFIQGALDDTQSNVEDELRQEDLEESSSLGIDFGYNSTDGYLMVDVRNTGSVSLAVEEEGEKNWNMYRDGRPIQWNYTKGSSYLSRDNILLDPSSTITLNTTEIFPSQGQTVEIEVTGTYNTRSTYICFSENGRCES